MVKQPEPSKIAYHEKNDTVNNKLIFKDLRNDGQQFSIGLLPADLIIDGKPIDPILYLKTNTEKELNSRGIFLRIPVK